jgi:hypothetical protein
METLGKITFDRDILNSFKFYIMLSIFLGSHGMPEERAAKSLNEYIHMLREVDQHFQDPEVTCAYMQEAYTKLPAEFLDLFEIPSSLGDGIRIVDKTYTWVK